MSAKVIIIADKITRGKVRNPPARANNPALRPIIIATGANAAAIGLLINPQSKLVSNPLNTATQGPASKAQMSVPIESRKIGSFSIELNCPAIILIAIENTMRAKVRLEIMDEFAMID
ncbi:hypothetical protein PROVRUST_07316 [Providencia rustigianii DSM 4541]|uniref:Uncharacterized protein n=1 Tax=Providencia rustigianii DSM 4541 TaxID=500637 RepID=D1P511_9GAMM|nr:hypothetical protein PROVRUST_07316 [Providencia rustigianii DSM 4541]